MNDFGRHVIFFNINFRSKHNTPRVRSQCTQVETLRFFRNKKNARFAFVCNPDYFVGLFIQRNRRSWML